MNIREISATKAFGLIALGYIAETFALATFVNGGPTFAGADIMGRICFFVFPPAILFGSYVLVTKKGWNGL